MPNTEIINWPPPYQIRRSVRAKNISLHITKQNRLEIVLPKNADVGDGLALLDKSKAWVHKHLKEPLAQPSLPNVIDLPAINKMVTVQYKSTSNKNVKAQSIGSNLVTLLGSINDFSLCQNILKKQIQKIAKKHLPQLLLQQAEYTGLMFSGCNIRTQTTMWGSCSPDGAISLNSQLLFLPFNLARHVLIHELCHLKHLNHSKRFWALVKKFDVESETHRKLLHRSDEFIPEWFRY